MKVNKHVRDYLRQIGAKGGKKATHAITPEKQAKMQAARKRKQKEAK